jgi:chromosome segregation and condensation protein ScpB
MALIVLSSSGVSAMRMAVRMHRTTVAVKSRLATLRVNEKTSMTKLEEMKDKTVGKTKQVIAEVSGDGQLAEEGKEQVRKGEREKHEPGPNQIT